MEIDFRAQPGYAVDPGVMVRARVVAKRTGTKISETHDVSTPPSGADVVHTTRRQSTGTTKPDPDWRRVSRRSR